MKKKLPAAESNHASVKDKLKKQSNLVDQLHKRIHELTDDLDT